MSPPATQSNQILSRLIGQSKAISDLKQKIIKAAKCDYPVLITGETGVGKTLVAEIIHELSHRCEKEFLHQSCSNISQELFESELFGHEKGAFTGAVKRREGRIEVANGGTVFLDEIADMSLNSQAKLLNFLERGKFFRVGGNKTLKVDVRIIAASNKDLAREMKAGRFREDLYFRINVISLKIPPLRERKEDIPLLVENILNKGNSKVSEEALDKLVNYDYPGNVRELENILKRAEFIAGGGCIQEKDIIIEGEFMEEEYLNVSERLFQEMVKKGKSFWEVVHKPFLSRDLNMR